MNRDSPRPTALAIDDLARLLSAASGRTVTADQVRADNLGPGWHDKFVRL